MALRMVVFDVDGTLIYNASPIPPCSVGGFLVSKSEEPQNSGNHVHEAFSLPEVVGVPDSPVSRNVKENIDKSYGKIFLEKSIYDQNFMSFFDGALACISALNDSGYLLGIATGHSRKGLDRVFSGLDLSSIFVATGTADDGPGKPNPYILNKVISDVGVSASDAVMVGDSIHDMTMARAAGTYALGVTWGQGCSQQLKVHGAHAVVATFDDLKAWVMQNLPL